MAQPVIKQPNYMNAMTQGLGTNLAYMAESKKGGGNIMRGGGGGGGISKPQAAKDASDKLQADLAKENKERNALYKKKQAAEDKINRLNEKEAVKTETIRKEKALKLFHSYTPSVNQGNYRDFYGWGGEIGVDVRGMIHPDKAEQMEESVFNSYISKLPGSAKVASGKSKSVKEKVMGKYISGGEMTDRENQFIAKELKTSPPGGKQIIQTDQGYMIVDKNNPDHQVKLNINKPMTATQQDTVEKIKTLKDTIRQIGTLYKKDYVGMLQGRAGAVKTKTGLGTDEKEQMFRARTAELMKMVYALSGKQINQQEMERLRPFIPEVNDSDIAFETKLKAFETQLDEVIANKVEVFLGGATRGDEGNAPDVNINQTVQQPKFKILSVE